LRICGKPEASGDSQVAVVGTGNRKQLKQLKTRSVEQSEETRLIRAGVAGHGLAAKEEEEEGWEGGQGGDGEEGEEEGTEDDEENEGQGTGRRAMRISSKALAGQQCGVGLVLESWKPRGLAQALNLVTR
jgi:hypothetical protein